MLLDDEIVVKVNNRHIKYYKNIGYDARGNENLKIKIFDLPKSSHYKVKVQCDCCQIIKEIKYYNYVINIDNNQKYICSNCKGISIVNSNLQKYGVRSTLELYDIKEKIKKTMLNKYGVDHYSKSEEFKKMVPEKYGVKSTLELPEIRIKTKKTLIDRYGVDHYSKCDEFKDQIKKTCISKYNVSSYSKTDDFKEKIRMSVLLRRISKNQIQIINYQNNIITAKCEKNHNYEIHIHTLKNRINYNTEICTICNPIGTFSSSGHENQLQDFIKENYNKEIIQNNRDIIKPYELDIYLPELKLAFEFNGLYWHNEFYKYNSYHLNKTELCEEKEIHLIQIYEDDWIYKQDIVKSIILNKLGKTSNKIYARKTIIKEINDNKLVREFLDKNHIQGFIGSKIKIGLFFNSEIVSLMTFGNRRVAMGKKTTNIGEYELLRFCNKLNTNVIGGASKLFKYFIDNYNPKEITTYADRSFSQGKLYETLGFELQGKTEPNYYYIIDDIRHHRFSYRKDVLVKEGYDKNKTEHQIMLERKIYRIYDSGNLKFIYNKK